MKRFLPAGTTIESNKDIHNSTRYDDHELVRGSDERNKLDWLSHKLNLEISLSSNNVLKMERLQERYHSDGLAAQLDGRMGHYMRYVRAYEQLNVLIEAHYLPHKPVTIEGKKNGDSD